MQNLPAQNLNIAVIGGGESCKSFLDLLTTESFPDFHIKVICVYDTNPDSEGMRFAGLKGIPTTDDIQEILSSDDINTVIQFTDREEISKELIRLRSRHVSVLTPDFTLFLFTMLKLNQKLKSVEYQMNLEKMFSDFIIHHMDAAIAVVNTDFRIVEANDPYLKIVSRQKEDVLGSYCYEIYYGLKMPCSSANPALRCPMLETLKTGKTAQVIHEYPTAKDRETYCNILTYPLRNQHGEITEVIEIWRDITHELSQTWEKRTNDLKADLKKVIQEDRMISLGKLVASCVHEINNPIQGMLTFSTLMGRILDQGKPSPEDLSQFKEFLGLISLELERCGNIVSGLLSFSRETPLEYRTLDFHEIVAAVISLTQNKMKLQNITLKTKLCPEMAMIRGDTNQLQQVMLNLIFNAIEAMPKGGILHIETRLQKDTGNFVILIQDTGVGIAKDKLEHIFDPFFSTKEEGKGTGLGLSIAYGVDKNHRGKIKVESEENKGTIFTLSFPTL